MLPRRAEGAQDVLHVVAVALDHVPAEGAPLVGERADPADVLDVAVDLLAVVVDDGAQLVELAVAGEHRRLPDLSLLLLTVAHHAVDAPRVAVDARRHGDAAAHR